MSVSILLGRASLRQDTISILHDAKRNTMTSECLNPERLRRHWLRRSSNYKMYEALYPGKKGPTVWAFIIEPSSPRVDLLGLILPEHRGIYLILATAGPILLALVEVVGKLCRSSYFLLHSMLRYALPANFPGKVGKGAGAAAVLAPTPAPLDLNPHSYDGV